jgi:hypothetical protein
MKPDDRKVLVKISLKSVEKISDYILFNLKNLINEINLSILYLNLCMNEMKLIQFLVAAGLFDLEYKLYLDKHI